MGSFSVPSPSTLMSLTNVAKLLSRENYGATLTYLLVSIRVALKNPRETKAANSGLSKPFLKLAGYSPEISGEDEQFAKEACTLS